MIPEDVSDFKTPGEKTFYRFLELISKKQKKYIIWYLPDINGKEPDFILYCSHIGLLILEVKDWNIKQIREANQRYFEIYKGEDIRRQKNPLLQGKDYREILMDKIRKDGILVSKDHYGNPKIPIDHGVVFPNIIKKDFIDKNLDRLFPPDKVFFWDEIHPDSGYFEDDKCIAFDNKIKKMFSIRFAFNLSAYEFQHMKQLISPVVKIRLPARKMLKVDEKIQRIKVLDNNQEALARKFDNNRCIITGRSGSGKTLVLVHKAAFLKQYNPRINSILFLCFNITLVNFIKRLLTEQNVGLGVNGVQVCHFYELCSIILGEPISFQIENNDYYRDIVDRTLKKTRSFTTGFDAILVDEGQDLTDEMFNVIKSLLKKQTDNLTIVLDQSQNIYGRKLEWLKEFEKDKFYRLNYVYRCTKQINEFVGDLLDQNSGYKSFDNENEDFCQFEFEGSKPVMKELSSFDDVVSFVGDEISKIVRQFDFPLSEIAVIYAGTQLADNRSCPGLIGKELISKGIMYKWASEDYPSKRTYDITTESVTLSTIHSVKGLDFLYVFLVGLDLIEEEKWSNEHMQNLAYVAITRSKNQLIIPYINEKSFLIKKLLSNF